MNPMIISAASGLRSRMESLDMIANNLANAATSGFKKDSELYGLYSGSEDAETYTSTLPVIEKPWIDHSQGTLQVTSNPFDVAIRGKGFFAVKGPTNTLYTRSGNFQMKTDGTLATAEGHPVLLDTGSPLKLDPNQAFEVGLDGSVVQNGMPLGKLQTVAFPDPTVLNKQGSTYFQLSDPKVKPAAAAAEIHQGKLEGSNVNTAESAVRLVSVMRQFEMINKAISLAGEMDRRVVEDLTKTSS